MFSFLNSIFVMAVSLMAESHLTEYNRSSDFGPSRLRPSRTLDQVT
jgi:hypothetical protein